MGEGAIPSPDRRSRRGAGRVVLARARRTVGIAAALGIVSILGLSATTLVLGRDRDAARSVVQRARLVEAGADRIVDLSRRAQAGDAGERAAFSRSARRVLLRTAQILNETNAGDELAGLRVHPRIIGERVDDADAENGDNALRRVEAAAGDLSLAAGIAADLATRRETTLDRWVAAGAWGPPALLAFVLGATAIANRTAVRRSILLIDDDPVSRSVLAALLGRRGLNVVLADSGANALNAVDRTRFDLIIVDLRLPDIDGIELTRRLRERPTKRRPVILLVSAGVSRADAGAALEAGADAALEKPLVWERVAPWLDRRIRGEAPPASSGASGDFDESRVREMLELLPPAKVRELAVRAAGSLRESRAEMNEAGDAGDLSRLSDTAHKVAGLAGIYGCVALREAARALETAIERGDTAPTRARLLVEERFAAAIERVDALFDRR